MLKAHLSSVSFASCDLSYANLSEGRIGPMTACDTRLTEAALQGAKLGQLRLDGCDLTRIDVFKTSLSGVDVSRCVFAAPIVSGGDFVDCSAPGLNLLKARLSSVSFTSCDLSYANLSEGRIGPMTARDTRLSEAALQGAKLGQVRLDGCDLTRIDVFKTSLSGMDVSRCVFAAPIVSGDYHELRGLTVNAEQALALSGLLGIQLADD